MFDQYNGTYHSHRDFIAVYHPSLSYKHEQLQEEDNNFREWMFLYYDDKDHEAMIGFFKEWKALYESKNIDRGYTIYTAGLGNYGPVIVVHSWGKSEVEHAKAGEENIVKLGEERNQLREKTRALVQKTETKRGYYMKDISYMPEQ